MYGMIFKMMLRNINVYDTYMICDCSWYVFVAQVAAWRFGIDAKGRGQLNFNEFCTAVRRALPATSVDQRDTFLTFF